MDKAQNTAVEVRRKEKSPLVFYDTSLVFDKDGKLITKETEDDVLKETVNERVLLVFSYNDIIAQKGNLFLKFIQNLTSYFD